MVSDNDISSFCVSDSENDLKMIPQEKCYVINRQDYNKIKQVLPENIKDKVFWCSQSVRTSDPEGIILLSETFLMYFSQA